jgi:type III secretion protein V
VHGGPQPRLFSLPVAQSPSPLSVLATRRHLTADAALAAFVIGVVTLMVVPLPTWVLDLLLAANLAISVAILLVTLYVGNALKVAGFPTLLLLTTLVRLALNVSSTRLILLQADAGRVIDAFGHFVVRGNYVVGAVVFLILTLIQFVVIAKGSERVAEVGARFTLDAMPGKQMAIDAEQRAGTIDAGEAQRQRRMLNRESQFYGAMDGAMKFVKGDVVASFVITLINIGAGLIIGVFQRDMELGDAVKRYGLLTIGDGLVSQIPALILATAAGILVTRVASENDETALGQELATQIFGAPKALTVASVFVLLLAVVPGLPALPFLAIGALMFAAASARKRQLEREVVSDVVPETRQPTRASRLPAPWSLNIGPALEQRLKSTAGRRRAPTQTLEAATELARQQLFQRLGVILPPCLIVVGDHVPTGTVVLSIRDVPAKRIRVPDGDASDVAALIGESVSEFLLTRAHDFMGLEETQLLLNELARVAPASVQEVVPKLVSVPALSEILRLLIEEGVGVRDLKSILEALAQVAHVEKDALALTEHVRSWLRRAITYELTDGTPLLEPLTLDDSIEDVIRGAITRTAAGSFLTLSPAASRDIVESIRRALEALPSELRRRPIVLTQPDIRRFVRKLIEVDFPDARVITYAELLPEISIRAAGTAGIAGL